MASQQFVIAIYDKFKALWEAHTPLQSGPAAVRVGNWLDWESGKAIAKRYALKDGKGPADYPEVSLDLGGFTDNLFTDTPNYGMRNPATPASSLVWNEQFRQDYVLTLIFDNRIITTEQLVTMEALTALRKGGPRLGFSYVARWGPAIAARTFETTDETARQERSVVRITIPVYCTFNGQDLIT